MDEKTEVHLKDYEMVRTEAHETISNRNQILSYGLATIGLLTAGILTMDTPNPLSIIAGLIYGIPAISGLILLIWLGEVERMVRAGRYLLHIETKLDKILKAKSIYWARHILLEGESIAYSYFATIFLFMLILIGVPIYGVFLGNIHLLNIHLLFPFGYGGIILIIVFCRFKIMRKKNLEIHGQVRNEESPLCT